MANVKTWKSDEVGCTISIDYDLCDGQGECADACPMDVFEIVDGKSTAPKIDECTECCACVSACSTGALNHSSC